MVLDRDQLRWNGWGWKHESFELSDVRRQALVRALAARFGVSLTPPAAAVPVEAVVLPPSRLGDAARSALEVALGKEQVLLDRAERAYHAAGKSLADLLRIRSGNLERAPDAVVYPASAAEVARVLAAAREHDLAVVPFGGGTSVVGGVEPILPTVASPPPSRPESTDRAWRPSSAIAVIRSGTFRSLSSTRPWAGGSRRARRVSNPTGTAASTRSS